MSEDVRRVLDMLAEGKINAAEAEQLLKAMGPRGANEEHPGGESREVKKKPRFLRIMVEGEGGGENGKSESADIRIPLNFLKAGIKLGACIPGDKGNRVRDKLRKRGIDLDDLQGDLSSIEEVIAGLGDLSVDVKGKNKEKVRIVCE